jgi:hypothetical protein
MSEDETVVLSSVLKDWLKYVVVYSHQDQVAYSIGIKHVLNTRGAEELFRRLSKQQFRKHKKPLHGFLCQSVSSGTICPFGRNCRDIHVTPEGFRERRLWNRSLQFQKVTTAGEVDTRSVESIEQALLQSMCTMALVLSTTAAPLVLANTSVTQVPFRPTGLSASASDSVLNRLFQSQIPYPSIATVHNNNHFYPPYSMNEAIIPQTMITPGSRTPSCDTQRSKTSPYYEASFQSLSQLPASPSYSSSCPHCGGQWSKEPRAFLNIPLGMLQALNSAAGQNLNASIKFPCELTITVCGAQQPQ